MVCFFVFSWSEKSFYSTFIEVSSRLTFKGRYLIFLALRLFLLFKLFDFKKILTVGTIFFIRECLVDGMIHYLFKRIALRENCPKTNFFLLRIFLYLDGISVFSPNTGKCGPDKTPYLGTFHAVLAPNLWRFLNHFFILH